MSESKILSRAEFTEAISRGEDDDVMLIERHDAALRADRDNWKDAYDRLHERYQNVSGSADAAEKALDVAKAEFKSLRRERDAARETWRCFHCGFETADTKLAGAHFGDRDDPEECTPLCRWWKDMSPEERGDALQDVVLQLNEERSTTDRLASERDAAIEAQTELRKKLAIEWEKDSVISERNDEIVSLRTKLRAAIEAGKADKARIEAYRAQVLSWAEAYPEDGFDGIFSRLPPASTESHELRMYRTRASAAMGRHMSACILKTFGEIDAAMQAAQVEKPE